MIKKQEKYHLVGVVGVGMSAIASALIAAGHQVSGSDRYFDQGEKLRVIDQLQAIGVTFYPQNGSGVNPDLTAVVITTAVTGDDCPDEVTAKELGVPVIHRSVMLAKLMEGHETIAITGTCGKSTVTGMIGHVLAELGQDPFVINGAPVINWMKDDWIGNVRIGNKYFVFEADESDKSLVNYDPDWVLITNASRDHHTIEDTQKIFDDFLKSAKKGSVSAVHQPELLANFSPTTSRGESLFTYKNVDFTIPLPGRHNAENAFMSVLLLEKLGLPLEKIAGALKSFRGIHRRLEKHAEVSGITVYDDYAHNPAKIEAAISAIRPTGHKLIIFWRFHSYTILRKLFTELIDCFVENIRPKDKLIVLPIYDAGGTVDRSMNTDALVKELIDRGAGAEFVPKIDEALDLAANYAEAGDVIVTMGARDPHLPEYADQIIKKLKSRFS